MKVYQIVDDAIVCGVFGSKEKAGAAIIDLLLSKSESSKLLEWLRVDVLEVL